MSRRSPAGLRPGALALALLMAGMTLGGGLAAVGASTAGQFALLDRDEELLDRADAARMMGSTASNVTVDEFVDFACPDCARFHVQSGEQLEAVVREENVLFRLRVYPLVRLMRGYHAAEAAFCAGALGGAEAFRAMEDALFRGQDEWRRLLDPTPVFAGYANRVGLGADEFAACTARDAMAPLILLDIEAARSAAITGTPTFVINPAGQMTGRDKLQGNASMDDFRAAIARVRGR